MNNQNATKYRFYALEVLYKFATTFIISSYVAFLVQKGFSFKEIGLVNALFMGGIFLFEIPTGMIADLFGRKISFLVSAGLRAVAMFLYCYSTNIYLLGVGALIAALAETCHSGAFAAWFYDSMRSSAKTQDHTYIFSTLGLLASLTGLVGGTLGAYIFKIDPRYPWWIASIIFILTFLFALTIPEEFKKKITLSPRLLVEFKHLLTQSFQTIRFSATMMMISIIVFLSQLAVAGPDNYWQPHFSLATLNAISLEYIWIGMCLMGILANYMARFFTKKPLFHPVVSITFLNGLSLLALFFLPVGWLSYSMLMVHVFMETIRNPIIQSEIHRRTPSEVRATLASTLSLIFGLGSSLGVLIAGYAADYWSTNMVWLLASVFCALQVLTLILFPRSKRS